MDKVMIAFEALLETKAKKVIEMTNKVELMCADLI